MTDFWTCAVHEMVIAGFSAEFVLVGEISQFSSEQYSLTLTFENGGGGGDILTALRFFFDNSSRRKNLPVKF